MTNSNIENKGKSIRVADFLRLLGDSTEVYVFQYDFNGDTDALYWGFAEDVKEKFYDREIEDIYAVKEDCIRICVVAE